MVQNQHQRVQRPIRIAVGAVCFAFTMLAAPGGDREADELRGSQAGFDSAAAPAPAAEDAHQLAGAGISTRSSPALDFSPHQVELPPSPADLGSQAQPVDGKPRSAALVVDANTGKSLFADAAGEPRFPASLTKMMTLYILFEELEAGQLSLRSELTVSSYAASTPPSKLGLAAGRLISVEDAIFALALKSANDVAVVVAENLEGSVAAFSRRMTRTAEAIGMRSTVFTNPHGLPDPMQVSTAEDIAVLGLALHDRFPSFFHVFSTQVHSYEGASFRNTNKLLAHLKGMEGIKTGYTTASGFNLVSSVKRDGRHIIAVVMGGRTAASRDADVRELIERHLPAASARGRIAPVLITDTSHVNGTPLPRARPGQRPVQIASHQQDTSAVAKPGEFSGGTDPQRHAARIRNVAGEARSARLAGEAPGSKTGPCFLIEAQAREQNLPVSFLTRLIWKESSFNPNAVSPVGAQGIAQFMPATAAERGLADPFDPGQAIPHAASFLRELNERFGNLGLAAAAYNAGPGRVQDWLDGKSGLPNETKAYVLSITGRAAANWREAQGDSDSDSTQKWDQEQDCERTVAEAQNSAPVRPVALAASPHAKATADRRGSRAKPAANGAAQTSKAAVPSGEPKHGAPDQDSEIVVKQLKRSGGRQLYAAQAAGSASGGARQACDRQRSSGNQCIVVVKHSASAI